MTQEEFDSLKASNATLTQQLQLLQAQAQSRQQPVDNSSKGPSSLEAHFKKLPGIDLSSLKNADNSDFIDALAQAINSHTTSVAEHGIKSSHLMAKEHFAEFSEHIAPALQHAHNYGEEKLFGETYKEYDGLTDYDTEFRSFIKANSSDPLAQQLTSSPSLLRKHYADGFVKANPKLVAAGLSLNKVKEVDPSAPVGGNAPPRHGGAPSNIQRPAATASSGTGEVIPPSQAKSQISLFD